MNNAEALVMRYAHRCGCTVKLSLINPAVSYYEDNEIAKYLKVSTKAFRSKMRQYGAVEKKFRGFKNRLYLADADVTQKFIDEYVSALLLADKLGGTIDG